MKTETDLESVKKVAIDLLNVPILKTEFSPMIVSHPFTKCGIATIIDGNDFEQLDITKSKENLEKWQNQMKGHINESHNAFFVFSLLNDSYRLMFLNKVACFLSQEDFSELLGDAWVSSEYANLDMNVSKTQLLKLFKGADKKALMTESELETYNESSNSL